MTDGLNEIGRLKERANRCMLTNGTAYSRTSEYQVAAALFEIAAQMALQNAIQGGVITPDQVAGALNIELEPAEDSTGEPPDELPAENFIPPKFKKPGSLQDPSRRRRWPR
jgi:hypothetical protein